MGKKTDGRSFKFSKASIEKLPLPATGRVEYTDTEIRALRLRVLPPPGPERSRR